jgi:hypothetical protein
MGVKRRYPGGLNGSRGTQTQMGKTKKKARLANARKGIDKAR